MAEKSFPLGFPGAADAAVGPGTAVPPPPAAAAEGDGEALGTGDVCVRAPAFMAMAAKFLPLGRLPAAGLTCCGGLGAGAGLVEPAAWVPATGAVAAGASAGAGCDPSAAGAGAWPPDGERRKMVDTNIGT